MSSRSGSRRPIAAAISCSTRFGSRCRRSRTRPPASRLSRYPEYPRKVSKALAFQSDDIPTLPALALQMYGSEVYETWLTLLENSARPIGATYLPNWHGLDKGPVYSDLSRTLRLAFKQNPEFGRKVHQAYDNLLKKDTGLAAGRSEHFA